MDVVYMFHMFKNIKNNLTCIDCSFSRDIKASL